MSVLLKSPENCSKPFLIGLSQTTLSESQFIYERYQDASQLIFKRLLEEFALFDPHGTNLVSRGYLLKKPDRRFHLHFPVYGNKPAVILTTRQSTVVNNNVHKLSRVVRGSSSNNKVDPLKIKKSPVPTCLNDKILDDGDMISGKFRGKKSCLMC